MTKANKPHDVFKFIDMSGGVNACWPFTGGLNKEGRPYISINGRKELAYRIVYELATGERLGTRLYRHSCDNEICCNYNHGIPGDHQENMNDMKERERHGLSHHMVRVIRSMCNAGNLTDKQIGEIVGLSATTIRDIRTEKNYGHVKDN